MAMMMIELIIQMLAMAVFTVIANFGIRFATTDGQIFGFMERWHDWIVEDETKPFAIRAMVEYLSKPIFTCPDCMGSVWTIINYFILATAVEMPYPFFHPLMAIQICLATGLAYLIHRHQEHNEPIIMHDGFIMGEQKGIILPEQNKEI